MLRGTMSEVGTEISGLAAAQPMASKEELAQGPHGKQIDEQFRCRRESPRRREILPMRCKEKRRILSRFSESRTRATGQVNISCQRHLLQEGESLTNLQKATCTANPNTD